MPVVVGGGIATDPPALEPPVGIVTPAPPLEGVASPLPPEDEPDVTGAPPEDDTTVAPPDEDAGSMPLPPLEDVVTGGVEPPVDDPDVVGAPPVPAGTSDDSDALQAARLMMGNNRSRE